MAKLPELNQVEKVLEEGTIPQVLRPYLGYSLLGHKCGRFIWYHFRWMFKKFITRREQRLFNRGHQEEYVVVKDLREKGLTCTDVLEDQIQVVGFMGHIKGHPDGDVIGVPGAEKKKHNLEIKTANDKSFREFFRFGVERSSPRYFVQSQAYMHHKGLDRTLFIITNKNDDSRHYERLHYNPKVFNEAEEKGCDIIMSTQPLPKLSNKPEWYECKFCDAYGICHGNDPYERNCRTCSNSRIKDNGEWHCTIYPGKPIPTSFQRTGCRDEYSPLL